MLSEAEKSLWRASHKMLLSDFATYEAGLYMEELHELVRTSFLTTAGKRVHVLHENVCKAGFNEQTLRIEFDGIAKYERTRLFGSAIDAHYQAAINARIPEEMRSQFLALYEETPDGIEMHHPPSAIDMTPEELLTICNAVCVYIKPI